MHLILPLLIIPKPTSSLPRWNVKCLWCTQHRLIASETTSLGSIRSTEVYPREILKMALRHNASAVILAHNHPSGNTEPSQADRVLTQKLMGVLELIDVRVLDLT